MIESQRVCVRSVFLQEIKPFIEESKVNIAATKNPYLPQRTRVELAGVSDVLAAKEYIQRTAEFELTLVEKGDVFKKICSAIDNKSSNTFKLLAMYSDIS